MRSLRYRPDALADLDEIYDHIARDNPQRAFAYIADIRERCRHLVAHPELGPRREDLGRGIRTHSIFRRIVVACRIEDDAIVIVRIFSAGRDHAAIMGADERD